MLKLHKSFDSLKKSSKKLIIIGSAATFKEEVPQQTLAAEFWQLFKPAIKDALVGERTQSFRTLTNTDGLQGVQLIILANQVSRSNSPTNKEAIYLNTDELETDPRPAVIAFVEDPSHAKAVIGALARRVRLYSRKTDGKEVGDTLHLMLCDRQGQALPANKEWSSLFSSVQWTCKVVDTAPSDMNPKLFAEEIKTTFKSNNDVSIQEIKGSALLKQKLGGIHAVGRAATEEPRMLVLTYNPGKSKASKSFAMIGKGVTYDTGGLSLKIQGSMVGMKSDMGGAAAVLGAFQNLVNSGFKHQLIACVGLVENAIGPTSYKNDDIITMHSGKTVEINNTDAEGRLVLADCVSYVARKLKPDYLFDAATLTGAQMVATGLLHAGLVSNEDDLESAFIAAGKLSGDMVAPLPFAPEIYQEELKSQVADMRNSVKNRMNAQSSCAAQFIYAHIADLKPAQSWAHIDLAGPSMSPNGIATGYGVALFSQVIQDLATA